VQVSASQMQGWARLWRRGCVCGRAWKPLRRRFAVSARQIAYYKIPITSDLWTIFRHALGKIQKYKIREFEIEARGLQQVANAATA